MVLEDSPVGFSSFPREFLSGLGKAEELQMLRVSGDSMEPELRSGDHIILDRSQSRMRKGVVAPSQRHGRCTRTYGLLCGRQSARGLLGPLRKSADHKILLASKSNRASILSQL